MKKRKYLLVHPEISRTKYNFKGVIENECLDLEHISAVLKADGNEVCLWDGQVEDISLKAVLKKYNPDVVYVTGRCRQENFMLEYCRNAKEYSADIITIIGGMHAQMCYDRLYRDYVDFIFTSYDVFLIQPVLDGDGLYSDVEGLCYRDESGEWKHNHAKSFDINRLPKPDRTYFYEHPDNYRYLAMEHAAWVRTAYSCPYRCKFCHRNRMNASTYSARNIADVVDEIREIPGENIYIVDDDFLFDRDRLLEFIRLIREYDIHKKYICYGRADFISANEDIMQELKDIGFYYILVGLEAFDEAYLINYGKRADSDQNKRTIEICNSLDLRIMGMFILDLDFTPKDFKKLYKYVKDNHIRNVAVSIYTPEMGMETYDAYKDRIITDNPSHFDYLHLVAKPEKISVRRYYFCYYKLLIKLFLRAKREGVYDFIDYGDYIRSFVRNIFVKRKNDNE